MVQSKELEGFFKKITGLVDPRIKEVLSLSVGKKTQKLLHHQIKTGGKRLRPALAALSCLVCGGKMKDILYPAAGLEILHNCTLIYDDIIDESSFRRNKPTTWVKFGKSMAECLGVDYGAAIFQAANLSKKPFELSELFAKTLKQVIEGEILDILFEQSGRQEEKYIVQHRYKKIGQKDYLDMVRKKTTSLFVACCLTGAEIAGAKKLEREALKKYGFNLGIAFQIQDDILDIFGKEKEFGKEIGHDIKERKMGNIVILFAFQELPLVRKKKVLAVLKKKKITNKDIKGVVKLIKETKAKELAAALGQKYIKQAKKQLKSLPQNQWNKLLADLADFIIKRTK